MKTKLKNYRPRIVNPANILQKLLCAELCPLKRNAEVLNILECDVIWKQGHCRCIQDQVILRQAEPLTQYDWCPYKRRRRHTGEHQVITEPHILKCCNCKPRNAKIAGKTPE